MKINLQLFATTKTDEEIAREVIAGKWGNGTARKNNLTQAGYNASNVQNVVNAMLNGSYKPTNTTTAATTTPTTTPTTYKYEEFKYDPYTESNTVTQAKAMLQEHMANKPGEYNSQWQAQLNDTLNKILNREEFSYDLNGDVLYQQYKDQFTTQGKQAMMDTMGQAAAMTGGYGNSYAQTVGQQTYQGYLQQLNDKVPELYQIALNQYNQEGQDLKDQAILLGQQDEKDYGRYRDSVSDFYTNLDYLTGRADKEAATDYERWSDKVGMDYDLHSDKQTAGYQEKQDANTLAMAMLGLGTMPSADILAKAGISSADAQAMVNKVKENEAAVVSDSSGGTLSFEDSNAMVSKLQTYQENKDNAGLEKYLTSLLATGAISEEQFDALYEQYYTKPFYEETDAVKDFKVKIRTKHEFARGNNPDKTKYKTYENYVKAMLEKYEKDLTDDEVATIAQYYGLKKD